MTETFNGGKFHEKEKLDGRIAFASTTFALVFAFSALLDRFGAPQALVEAVAPYFTVLAFAALGVSLHSMRASSYYAAGRAVPPEYAGFANAALLAAMMLPFAAEFSTHSWLLGPGAGVFIGVAILGGCLGPMLRKAGAFSLSSLLSARFPGFWTRLGVIAIACLSSALVAMAGEQSAVDVLTGLLGGQRSLVAAMIGLSVVLIAGPGGLLGTVWTACAAGAVAVAGLAWPAAKLALSGAPPFDATGGAWRAAEARLEGWGFIVSTNYAADFAVTLAVALGVATLAPLLAPAIAAPREGNDRRAGISALGWTLVFATLIATSVAGAALSLARQGVGQPAERLTDAVYAASAHGLVTVCGAAAPNPASARRACAKQDIAAGKPLRPRDIGVRSESLLTALPRLEQMGAAASGLLAAAQIGLALALAAAGLQAFGTALGHDAFFRMRGKIDLTSRRLAVTRLAQATIAGVGAAASAYNMFDPRALLGLALGVCAAAAAPVAALALWPRATHRDALLALATGLYVFTAALLLQGALTREGLTLAALAGAALGLGAGVWTAQSRQEDPAQAEAFLTRLLRGDSDVMGPEKGA